jgi:hypothetical protein
LRLSKVLALTNRVEVPLHALFVANPHVRGIPGRRTHPSSMVRPFARHVHCQSTGRGLTRVHACR